MWRRRSHCRWLTVHIYGRMVTTIKAYVGVIIPSRTLGDTPIQVIIFPQRSGKKMNILLTSDLTMDPVRLLELYAARFRIEDAFDELMEDLETVGSVGFALSNDTPRCVSSLTVC